MAAAAPGFVAATGDPLTLRTYGTFFANLDLLLRAEVTTVAEAAFQHRLWVEGLTLLDGLAELKVIRCRIGEDQARDRMQRRRSEQPTRAAHADLEHLAAGVILRTAEPGCADPGRGHVGRLPTAAAGGHRVLPRLIRMRYRLNRADAAGDDVNGGRRVEA